MLAIIRQKGQIVHKGSRGNEEIEIADNLTAVSQLSAKLTELPADAFVEIQNGDALQESFE